MTMRGNARFRRLRRTAVALTVTATALIDGCMTSSPLSNCHGPWSAVNSPAVIPASGGLPRSGPSTQAGGQRGEH